MGSVKHCDQTANAQADLNLRWVHMSEDTSSDIATRIFNIALVSCSLAQNCLAQNCLCNSWNVLIMSLLVSKYDCVQLFKVIVGKGFTFCL